MSNDTAGLKYQAYYDWVDHTCKANDMLLEQDTLFYVSEIAQLVVYAGFFQCLFWHYHKYIKGKIRVLLFAYLLLLLVRVLIRAVLMYWETWDDLDGDLVE